MNIHFARTGEQLCDETLHYRDCGLDNIYLQNGFSKLCEDGEEHVAVTDIDGLHEAIGLHIVLARKAPSGNELRFLRNEMGYSQAGLADTLDVSDQSIARWEKSQSDINGPAMFALRVLYVLSRLPNEERQQVLDGLLERLSKLMAADETCDDIVLSFENDKWHDPALIAA